jgi:predicted Zn-dependent protease
MLVQAEWEGRSLIPSERLDGWKAIGSYFGRDRTTVMRWARTRGLPVRRLPGGKTATVFALTTDLAQWASQQTGLDEDVSEVTPDKASPHIFQRHWRLGGLALLVALAFIVIVALAWPRGSDMATSPELPSDPALSTLYLQARDDWAQRKPETLTRAIHNFEIITQKEPDFAPAWSSLADAYILAREFGTMPDKIAFPKAKAAAEAALKRNPDLAGAHRALGFILYWWDREPTKAGEAFRRAKALSSRDAQTAFWYGNILADNGQSVAALRELNTARLIEPGSVAIQTDLAWALWAAGRESEARTALEHLARQHPDFAVIYDCQSLIKLADGDYVGYVQDFTEYARLTNDKAMLDHVAQLRAALKVGAADVQTVLMSQALAEIEAGDRRTHIWPVFLASVAQDRKQVVDLLKRAGARQEIWGGAGMTSRVTRLWMDDAEIIDLVRRRKAKSIE